MLAAFASSVLFLAGYLTRVALTGTHAFPGGGALRAVYLAVLASHTLLAAAAAPMVLRTLFLALRDRFPDHRRIARFTLPIWMYVSVTGVAVYVMLYHLAPHTP
jgi:putative membrane protein